MTERIAVALCTRNGSRFVEAQLRSILAQQLRPDSVVVSDDASTDGTVAIVSGLAAEFAAARIDLNVIVNPRALGVTANFEAAIVATTAQLVVLSDQDDVWHPDRLSRLAAEFSTRPELDLVFSDARLVDEHGGTIGDGLFHALDFGQADREAVHAGGAFTVLLRRNLVTGATIAFRRRLLDAALPFPEAWVHDEWLAAIAAAVGVIDLVDEQLIDYRQHGSNEIGVRRATLRHKIGKVFEPRGGRNARLGRRAKQLAERLDSLGDNVAPTTRAAAHAKAEVEEKRAALPHSRWKRIGPIRSIDRQGGYASYSSQGRLDMLRDLLQPHS